MSDEELKSFDDGSISFMSKIEMNGETHYLVSLNIYPYSPIRVPKETFEEWKQFCDPVDSQIEGEHWRVKHFSEF